ncbi:MAG: rod shape-determining protein MreD [Clostridia bacterium]|nr:rod shape-determining protein MreD [Clostridia bacterium]
MKEIFSACFLLLALVLQSTILANLRVGGAKLDLILIAVSMSGLWQGYARGMGRGFCYGLFEDLLAARYVFSHALSKAVAGLIGGWARERFYPDFWLVCLAVIFIGTIVHEISFLLLVEIASGGNDFFGEGWFLVVLASAIYNGVAGLVLHPLFRWLYGEGQHASLKKASWF